MVIAQYTDKFWYPTGALATGIAVRVFPLNSNIFAPLWANQAGTIPLANPVTTDGTGSISFYAEEGDYWMHADTEAFRITVGGTPPVSELAEVTLSTGTTTGGDLSPNLLDPTAVDISAVRAFIVDAITDPVNPLVTEINEPDRTVQLDAAAQLRVLTWWLMDANGDLIQQAATPTPQQRRQFVVLGRTAFNPLTGTIIGSKSIHVMLQQQANQSADLIDSLGPFSLSGNLVTPVAGTLQFNKSAGFVFLRSIAHDIDPSNPHEGVTPVQTPAQFRRILRATAAVTPIVNMIDPANYDLNGVLTPVGGGTNTSTIQRVYLTPADNTIDQISVQYGQTTYSSLANAQDAIGAGTFTPNPGLSELAALIAYIAVTRTATNLADITQARVITAGKFATP